MQKLLADFIANQKSKFSVQGIRERKEKIQLKDRTAYYSHENSVLDDDIVPVSTMKYAEFIKELALKLNLNLKTLHSAMKESDINIEQYLNVSTLRILKQNFEQYLMYNAIDKFSIGYKTVTNSIHPTKLTDKDGNPCQKISSSDVGMHYSDSPVEKNYYFEDLFYDSPLEMENIHNGIKEAVVFTKIPKNSIKIPVAGGKSYSPDFAYVLHFENGEKTLHFIVETKDVDGEEIIRKEEQQKIKHAEQFFGGEVKIEFRTQFKNDKIVELIREIRG